MKRRTAIRCLALLACVLPRVLLAQFTDPRTYTQAPVGLNQLELDYVYAHSDASIDTSLVVVGAHFDVQQAVLSYTHNFSVLDHLAWAKAVVPFAYLSGHVAGTGITRSVSGAGDASVELGALLKGGKARSAADLESYDPETTLGVSLAVSAPTGEYNADRLLNLGSNRWSFKPELGLAHPFGPEQRGELDLYVNIYFFTDNTQYRGVEVLRQEPLPGLEGHLSYSFTPNLWASLDARYCFRGDTVLDGVNQDDGQHNLTAGTEVSWSPSAHHTLTLVVVGALVHQNSPAYTGAALKYVYSWGPGSG